jgi:hypothetical protein
MWLVAGCVLVNLMVANQVWAAEPSTPGSLSQVAPEVVQWGEPILPTDATWAGAAVIIMGGLFLAAASIGPIVRINMPAELPPQNQTKNPRGQ